MHQNIVITGANRGIGLELARIFSARGNHVWAICRKKSHELSSLNVKIVESIDVTDESCLKKLKNSLINEKIDLLINNAGIMKKTTLDFMDWDAMIEQFKVNSLAPLMMTEALLPQMNNGARIAMITSRMGSIADNNSGGSYGYRMSKAALNAASKSLAIDLKAKEIAVGILHPGWVKTDMTDQTGHLTAEESAGHLAQRIEELSIENSGTFWHCQGDVLPW